MKNIIYASDLDRTLIFSYRFLNENPYDKETLLVEKKDGKEISYMSKLVYDRLQEISHKKEVHFVPVTTRSEEEYKRIKLGFTPEYAIIACGGVILHNNEPIKEYTEYVRRYMNPLDMATIAIDLHKFRSLDRAPRLVDNCYLFTKTINEDMFDLEAQELINMYDKWEFVRQGKKCYIIPKHISKQIALRWLWNKLKKPYIIASGDSLLDIPMLALANKAIIPSHSNLIKDKIVKEGTIVDGGIESPYQTMAYVENLIKM